MTTGYLLIAGAIIVFGIIIYIIYSKIKGGVITFFTSGLNPHGEFSQLILSMADYINKKKNTQEESFPRHFIDDDRWLLESQGPKTFYYIDERQINDMYAQINQAPRLEEVTEKEKASSGVDGGLSSTAVSIKGTKGSESEKTKKYSIDNSAPSKYSYVESYLKDNLLINYGIAKFYTDHTQRVKFEEACNKLEQEFKFKVSENDRNQHWISLNKEFAYPTLDGIKNSSGNIAFQEDFTILEEVDGKVKLFFTHPINSFLEDGDKNVRICINCSKENLTQAGKTFLVSGKTIKATCVGKIIRWDEQTKSLDINPIAVF